MKRMFVSFVVVLLFANFFVTATASETKTAEKVDQPFTISVSAIYKDNDPNIYKVNISGDSSHITTRNGTKVTVIGTNEPFSGIRLVVREITSEETEAYNWFSGVLKGIGTDILPFEIYFEKDGRKIPLRNKIEVSINLPDSYTFPIACNVTSDGKVELLLSSVEGKISFETDNTSYYVLANKIKKTGDNPQTGDNTNLIHYIPFIWLSLCLFIITARRYRRVY